MKTNQRGGLVMSEIKEPSAWSDKYMQKPMPQFEDTIPTDFGGLNERRHYTKSGMRTGMLLLIASAVVTILAIVVIASTWVN